MHIMPFNNSGSLFIPCVRWRRIMAPPNEYDWAIHARRRCGLMSHYLDHLFVRAVHSVISNVLGVAATATAPVNEWRFSRLISRRATKLFVRHFGSRQTAPPATLQACSQHMNWTELNCYIDPVTRCVHWYWSGRHDLIGCRETTTVGA